MNSIDFCYWLQGAFELSDSDSITDKQVRTIKDKLNSVFLHEIDPLRESETTATKEELNNAHSGNASVSITNDPLARC
tara:strand:+ start:1471 stop:1704 length:234 start_codon:yes stop_codon:yes gene_type:complete